jgi:hypothetical protein
MKGRGGAFAVSWGKWGGFYWKRGYTTRLCLGWVALTYFPLDLDVLLRALSKAAPSSDLDQPAGNAREATTWDRTGENWTQG